MTPMTPLAAARGRSRTIGMATFVCDDPASLEAVLGDTAGVLATGVVEVDGREALRIEFDPAFVSYEQLLELFWERQERRDDSAIVLVHSLEQETLAHLALDERRARLGAEAGTAIGRAGRRTGHL